MVRSYCKIPSNPKAKALEKSRLAHRGQVEIRILSLGITFDSVTSGMRFQRFTSRFLTWGTGCTIHACFCFVQLMQSISHVQEDCNLMELLKWELFIFIVFEILIDSVAFYAQKEYYFGKYCSHCGSMAHSARFIHFVSLTWKHSGGWKRRRDLRCRETTNGGNKKPRFVRQPGYGEGTTAHVRYPCNVSEMPNLEA